jgi:hypothetical protein
MLIRHREPLSRPLRTKGIVSKREPPYVHPLSPCCQNQCAGPVGAGKVLCPGRYPSPVNTKDLAEAITSKTTLSETDVIAALLAIRHEVEIGLQEGKSIDLLDLCIIYPTLQSKGVDAPGDFRARKHIVRAGVRIRPKKSLIARLANSRFVRRK